MKRGVPVGQLITIFITLACLIGVVVMKHRCAGAVDGMFRALDQPGQPVQPGQPAAKAGDGGARPDGG